MSTSVDAAFGLFLLPSCFSWLQPGGQPDGNCPSGQVAGVFQGGTLPITALPLMLLLREA